MQIGIDVNPATREQKTGTENYVFNLIQAMKRLPLEPDEQIVLYSAKPLSGELAQLPAGWSSRVLHWPFKRMWTQLRFSWEMWRRPPDILFVPAHVIPRLHPRLTVTTVHDLGFRRLKNAYAPRARRYLQWSTKFAVGHAKTLLVPSEFTKRELMELYAVAENRIIVTPLASARDFSSPLPAHYFLTVSRLEEKKNILNLIRAFELFKSRRGIGDPFELVLVGKPGVGYEKIKTFLNASSVKGQIKELGWGKEEEIPALMKGAFAYVYPSWYEGFGISAVEAMTAGVPLIASDLPVMHEVAGDAAWYAPPNEPEVFARLFARLVDQPTGREQLVDAGRRQAQTFSWEATAKKTFTALRTSQIPDHILSL